MALVLVEGFDHLTASQITVKGWSAAVSSMQTGRFDGQCARCTNNSQRSKTLPSTYSTIFVGFALRTSNSTTGGSPPLVLKSTGGTIIAQVAIDTSGHLVVKNTGGTIIATGTTVIASNAWNYIELKLVVAGASGTCELHLNGATEIASTTGNFGSTNVGVIAIQGQNTSGVNDDFDDMLAWDTTGSDNNSFTGDRRVETIKPNGVGAHTQMTPNGAANNYACVNEATPDDDTTYVSDATVGDIDTYTFEDIDAGATVYGIQKNLYARKDDANTRQLAAVTRQGGTDSVGATQTLGTTYGVFSEISERDPAGAVWTPSNINGDEFGVKVIA